MRLSRAFIIALSSLLLPFSAASADDWSVVVNGKAFHVDATRDWNESNWGLGFEREFDPNQRWVKLALGNGFRDSQNAMSYMAGGGIKRRFRLRALSDQIYVDVGVIAFMMSRQDVDHNHPFPGILPALSVGSRRFAINLTYVPGHWANETANVKHYDPTLEGIVFLQLKLGADMFLPTSHRHRLLAHAGD